MTGGAVRRTVGLWSVYEPQLTHSFFGFEPLRPYLIETAFGQSAARQHAHNRWWAEDIVTDLHLRDRDQPVRSMLSLCCGFGAIEQHLVATLGTVERCVALDLAPGAVREARRRAEEVGLGSLIDYQVCDLNACSWPPGEFDLIIANGALHHLARVENVLDLAASRLSPGGLLYANERTGAAYSDFGTRQLELINAVAYLVPPTMRRRRPVRSNPLTDPHLRRIADAFLGNLDLDASHRAGWPPSKRALAAVMKFVTLPTRRGFGPLVLSQKAQLLANDPSEGVSSDRIVPAIRARFRDLHLYPYGGAVLAYALDDRFYETYDSENNAHVELLTTLCALERWLVSAGELPDEHMIIVASPRSDV